MSFPVSQGFGPKGTPGRVKVPGINLVARKGQCHITHPRKPETPFSMGCFDAIIKIIQGFGGETLIISGFPNKIGVFMGEKTRSSFIVAGFAE